MKTWLIHYVSGRTETVVGDLIAADRTFLKFRVTPKPANGGVEWINVVVGNVETWRGVDR